MGAARRPRRARPAAVRHPPACVRCRSALPAGSTAWWCPACLAARATTEVA